MIVTLLNISCNTVRIAFKCAGALNSCKLSELVVQKTKILKMVGIQKKISVLLLLLIGQIILSSICVQSVQAINDDSNQVHRDLFYLRNFDASNLIERVLSPINWITNHECLAELTAIRDGLENHEEWAIRGKPDLRIFKVKQIKILGIILFINTIFF